MNRALQLYGLLALTLLAVGILVPIGMTFGAISRHIGPDGRVPSSKASGFTALLLALGAESRLCRASTRVTSGYGPNISRFSFPWRRYFWRQLL